MPTSLFSPGCSITQERLAGYRAALEKHGVAFDENLVRYGNFGPDEVGPMVDELLALPAAPDAFFTASDRLAVGCLPALRQRNCTSPTMCRSLALPTCNVAELSRPPLSTVVQPAQQIGQIAAERLIDLIERKHRAQPSRNGPYPYGANCARFYAATRARCGPFGISTLRSEVEAR